MKYLMLFLTTFFLAGCAGLRFEEDGKRKGARIYYPKPYLLVEQTVTSDTTGKTTVSLNAKVLYLPDLANPAYVKVRRGFGKAELALTYENGVVKSINGNSDGKGAEAVGALAASLPGLAQLLTAVNAKPAAPELTTNFLYIEENAKETPPTTPNDSLQPGLYAIEFVKGKIVLLPVRD